MRMLRPGWLLLGGWLMLLPVTPHLHGQDWFFDVSLDQSFTAVNPLTSPVGFRASAGGIALWGPLGAQVTYASLWEGTDEVGTACAATCPAATGSRALSMRSLGLGVSYDFINPTGVLLTLGLTGSKTWQTERVAGVADELSGSGASLGASAHLRLRPVVAGIRPIFGLHYTRNWAGACGSGRSCWFGRNAYGATAGFGWVLRPHRED